MPPTPTVATTAAAAASISGKGVFPAGFMVGLAHVAFSIPCLVALEVVELRRSAFRHRPSVSVVRVIPVIDVTIESRAAAKPWTGSKEHSANKPVGPVVTVGGTIVGRIVEVPIGTHRRHSNIDANLSRPLGWTAEQGNCKN